MSYFGEPAATIKLRKRNRTARIEPYCLHVYDFNNTKGWGNLLELNGGESAPPLVEAAGTLHKMYMCCLVLHDDDIDGAGRRLSAKKQHQLQRLEKYCKKEPWWPYVTRIAIVVPVAVQSGVALAQGIKRLTRTCPCDHLRGLGMALLANVARHFAIEYLFMSPIDQFHAHVCRELTERNVPFGRLGARSLWWAVTEAETSCLLSLHPDEAEQHQWLTIKEGELRYEQKHRLRERAVYFLKIRPQPPFQDVCRPRTLILNAVHYVPRDGHDDPEYKAPPLVKFEAHDFLWHLAGDGVLVIHGPSLATMA